eukprot:CAMPEP_0117420544 /NCGR_PEP_ID=MMETSP0758-20121206/1854_1 /TAXON_ID=63605 /ORGANISM="Percolomonas cosmopolitus, Strain AE-1 (ATCC 50343)" /LENGTH=567 /DNA_ID=CAMNT_0005202211 /DNA_START=393 /DNA_END=2092 /DNA_ORIENTATION=-
MELQIAIKKFQLYSNNKNELNVTPQIALLESAVLDTEEAPKDDPTMEEEATNIELKEESNGEEDGEVYENVKETEDEENTLQQKIEISIPKVPMGSTTTTLEDTQENSSPQELIENPPPLPNTFKLEKQATIDPPSSNIYENDTYTTLHMYTPQYTVSNPSTTNIIPPFELTNTQPPQETPNLPPSKLNYLKKDKSPSPFSIYYQQQQKSQPRQLPPPLPTNQVHIPDFKSDEQVPPQPPQNQYSIPIETSDTLQSQYDASFNSTFVSTRRRHLGNKRRADEANLIVVLLFVLLFSMIIIVPPSIFQFWSLPMRYMLFFQLDEFPHDIPIIKSIILEQLGYLILIVLLCIFVFYVRKLNDVYKLYIQLKTTTIVLIIEFFLMLIVNILMMIPTTSLYGLVGNLIVNFIFGMGHLFIQMGIPILLSVPLLYENYSYRHKAKVDEHRSHYQHQIQKVNMLLNDHPKGVLLLLEHATRLLCMDEMLFIIEVHQFKRLRFYRLEKAYHIIQSFIEVNSTHYISLPSSNREQILGAYRESDHLSTDPKMFDKMVRFVLRRMSSRNIFTKLFT